MFLAYAYSRLIRARFSSLYSVNSRVAISYESTTYMLNNSRRDFNLYHYEKQKMERARIV